MVRLGQVIQAIQSSWRIESLRMELRTPESSWRYWQSKERRRLETYPEGAVQITAGDVSWRSSPDEGVIEFHNTTMSYGPPEGLVDLTGLLAANLTVADEDRIAGRPAARLTAKPRAGLLDSPSRWRLQSPETEIWVDIERGIGLKTPNLEVVEVAFDEPFDDQLFEAPRASGEIGEAETPAQIAANEAKTLTFDEAIAESPFPLMTPTKLPAGTRLLAWKKWDSPKFKWIGAIYLVEPGPYCPILLHLSAAPAPVGPDVHWDDLEVDGTVVKVTHNDRFPMSLSWARIERDGVIVSLQAALPAQTLAEIAASVRPL
jgi:hypothetical protein